MIIRIAACLVTCVIVMASPVAASDGEVSADVEAVLVTGASSGIGRKITEALAARGYYVYAGARKQHDLESLDAIDNVQSLRLDVTVQAEIDAAVAGVRFEGRGLYALVNNAGVHFTGPATEVAVSIIAPGDYASNIWSRDIALASEAGVVDDNSPYADDYRSWMELVANMELKEPDEVAAKAVGILSSDAPRRRYLIVPNEAEMAWVMGSAVRRRAELNADHAYSYTRAELAEMLYEAVADLESQHE